MNTKNSLIFVLTKPTKPMDTIIIETNCYRLEYPTGFNIVRNMPSILKTIEAFKSITEFHGVNVNLICRGSSGAIIAAIFAAHLDNHVSIIHIKKDGENSHDNIPCMDDDAVNVIVDDFIDTGATIDTIYKKVQEFNGNRKIVIDCLCITGAYRIFKSFAPKYVVAGFDGTGK